MSGSRNRSKSKINLQVSFTREDEKHHLLEEDKVVLYLAGEIDSTQEEKLRDVLSYLYWPGISVSFTMGHNNQEVWLGISEPAGMSAFRAAVLSEQERLALLEIQEKNDPTSIVFEPLEEGEEP